MKNYRVVVSFAGAIDVEVEAESEEEAEEMAISKFEYEDERDIVAGICDLDADSIEEIE